MRHDWTDRDVATDKSKCKRCGVIFNGENGPDFCPASAQCVFIVRDGRSLRVCSMEPNRLVPKGALELFIQPYGPIANQGPAFDAALKHRDEMIDFGLDVMKLVFNGGWTALDRHQKEDMLNWFGIDVWKEGL